MNDLILALASLGLILFAVEWLLVGRYKQRK